MDGVVMLDKDVPLAGASLHHPMSRHSSRVSALAGYLTKPMVVRLLTVSCSLAAGLPLSVPGVLVPCRLPAGKCAAAGPPCIGLLMLAEMHSDALSLSPDALQATCWLACSAGPQ